MLNLSAEERRCRIGAVVLDVIGRDGFDAATVRRIATELGCSTTVVTQLFADKDALLIGAYRTLGDISRAQRAAVLAADASDLTGYLLVMTSASERNLMLWRSYFSIWDRSLRDPALAAELRSWMEDTLRAVEALIAMRDPHRTDAPLLARKLIALVEGLSLRRVFDRDSWSPEAMRAVLTEEVTRLGG